MRLSNSLFKRLVFFSSPFAAVLFVSLKGSGCIEDANLLSRGESLSTFDGAAHNNERSREGGNIFVSDSSYATDLDIEIYADDLETQRPSSVSSAVEQDAGSVHQFVKFLYGLSAEEMAALNDEIFSSDIADKILDRREREFKSIEESISDITARANALSVEEFWGAGIEQAGLSDIEEHQVRQFLLDSFARNSELSELKRNKEITFEEYFSLRMTSEKIGAALVPIIGESKASSLLASNLDTIESRSVPYEVAAMQRDSVNFPAFNAVRQRDPVALESILAAGADVNAIPEYRPESNLLETGILFRDAQTVEVLLRYDVDLQRKNSNGSSVLHQAILSANPEILRLLLAAGADPLARNREGLTPAMSLRLAKPRLPVSVYSQMNEVLEAAQNIPAPL